MHAMSGSNPSPIRAFATAAYWWAMVVFGAGALSWSIAHWQPNDKLRFFSYLLSACIAAVLKVRLPGVKGAASVSFLFLLIGIVDLNRPDAIMMAACSMLVQCFRSVGRPRANQVAFSVANIAAAVFVSGIVYDAARTVLPEPAALAFVPMVYYVANTLGVACIIALTESKPLLSIARGSLWLLPYYACGASLAWMIGTMPTHIQWELPLICLPIVYVVHRSHRTFLGQVEKEMAHVEQLNRVHMRTIEALALAIDAKDHTTHDHLLRVQLYAVEIGRDLGLSAEQLDALRAASVLHDIGKLAVPEHIISKPGKLTPAEFQKMKIHPVVGAEILQRVEFPYPVVPIVRSHHEKWDGSGYPDGLKREEIPIGARILSVVDCFDALASDRQYRKALPIEAAMAQILSESETSFDPAVVNVLARRYRELEAKADHASEDTDSPPALSTDVCITRGVAPATGFAVDVPSIAAPTRPVRALAVDDAVLERLTVEEVLAVIAVRAKPHLRYDAFVAYIKEADAFRLAYAVGHDRIPAGILNWVLENGRYIVNANPASDPGYEGPLQSALVVPIEDSRGIIAVAAVYRRDRDGFNTNDAAMLTSLCRPLSQLPEAGKSAARSETSLAIAV